jgi:hypothetical protein
MLGEDSMARVIVYVSGGNVQDIISSSPGVEVMIVDYDNEKCSATPKRSFEPVRCDLIFFDRTMAGLED